MPGDSAMVGLVSCRGGGGSRVSGDRGWTFVYLHLSVLHVHVPIFVCTFTCGIFTI